jgi:PBP1b-binding outer membrane lipoprotein LpoB
MKIILTLITILALTLNACSSTPTPTPTTTTTEPAIPGPPPVQQTDGIIIEPIHSQRTISNINGRTYESRAIKTTMTNRTGETIRTIRGQITLLTSNGPNIIFEFTESGLDWQINKGHDKHTISYTILNPNGAYIISSTLLVEATSSRTFKN